MFVNIFFWLWVRAARTHERMLFFAFIYVYQIRILAMLFPGGLQIDSSNTDGDVRWRWTAW